MDRLESNGRRLFEMLQSAGEYRKQDCRKRRLFYWGWILPSRMPLFRHQPSAGRAVSVKTHLSRSSPGIYSVQKRLSLQFKWNLDKNFLFFPLIFSVNFPISIIIRQDQPERGGILKYLTVYCFL